MYEFRISWVVTGKGTQAGKGRGGGKRRGGQGGRGSGKVTKKGQGRAPLEYLPRGPRVPSYATDNTVSYFLSFAMVW